VWFWLTPIVYQGSLVQSHLNAVSIAGVSAWTLYLLNPLAIIVLGFQRALYGIVVPPGGGAAVLPHVGVGWHLATLGALLATGLVLFLLAWRSYFDRSGDFAEEL
jgi:ABC-2 type transport system permease protein